MINITGSPKVYEYTEITEDNIEEFHFHGDPTATPITAVIAVPFDEKSGTILRGRYLGEEESHQIVKPQHPNWPILFVQYWEHRNWLRTSLH